MTFTKLVNFPMEARVLRPGNPILVPSYFVQPQAAKKKKTSGAGPQNTKLSTIKIILASTDAMETGTATGKPLKPESM